MVPRLRHRIGIETLKRELFDAHAAQAKSTSPTSNHSIITQTITVEEDYCYDPSADYLSLDWNSRNCSQYSNSRQNAAVGDKIPGFRTSAAFLSSLRTNLRLQASPPPSPMSTPPQSMRASAASLTAPTTDDPMLGDSTTSDIVQDDTPKDPLANVPEIDTHTTTDPDELRAALKLVADSVAQMRQTASRILIFNPVNMAIVLAILAVWTRYLYKSPSDIGIVATTSAGLLMGFLLLVRFMSGPYLEFAEAVNVDLLEGADVIVTKFGEEIIGAVIVGYEPLESGSGRGSKKRKLRAQIRGWAVRLRYRGKGEGVVLLEQAVAVAKAKGSEEIEFAANHANSVRVLYDFYNGPFDRKEKLAREKLQAIWDATASQKRKR